MENATMLKFHEDDIIMKEGEIYEEMYKIIAGSVAVYIRYGEKEEHLIGIYSKPKCFGEVQVLSDQPSIYTVVAYGDVVLIICMLHDYVKRLDELRADDIVYQAYYREKFMKMADRLSEQIGYDYDKAVEKCMKKQQKKESSSDIGGDAMALALKYGTKGKKKEGEANAGADNKKEMV